MKKIFRILSIVSALSLSACDLDLYPVTSYNEGNVTVDENTESQYSTREHMQGLREALYNSNARDIQEKGYLDWLVYNECRADNAYCGSLTTGEIVAIEANAQDGANKNVDRDWSWYLSQLTAANQIICNIDRVKEQDPTMTDKEYQEWKSEALCWRSLMFYQMSQIWGGVPLITTIPPAITAENIEDLQTIPAGDLQAAAAEALQQTGEALQIPASLGGGYSMDWEPVVDGDFLPTDPVTEDSFAEAGRDIPLLIGSNLNEWSGFFDAGPIEETPALEEALRAAYELTRLEGIIPALESAHVLGALPKIDFKPDDVVVLTVSGRGDKDIETYLKNL